MTGLGLDDSEPQHRRRGDDEGWRPTLINAMWGVIVLIAGYMATDFASTRAKLMDQVNSDTQRISVLEEQNRNTRESLQRIENGVFELRQAQSLDRRPR